MLMDGIWLVAVGAALVILTSVKPLMTSLGKSLVAMDLKKGLDRAGLRTRVVTFHDGVSAHYHERPALGEVGGPPLLVLPGATITMDFMGARMARLFEELPNRRIIVLELPHHGKNATQNLDFEAVASTIDMADYLERFREVLRLEDPFDLIGYSLGGGIATEYAIRYPQRLRRLVLLAPYFYELATDAFVEAVDSDRLQTIHGWETFDEMKNFFHRWLGLTFQDAPPAFIMRGIHAQRTDFYPPGYWSACLRTLHRKSHDTNTMMATRTQDLAGVQRPTLIVTASDDAICDSKKLHRLQSAFGEAYCELIETSSGHTFGTGGRTLFAVAGNAIRQFLAS